MSMYFRAICKIICFLCLCSFFWGCTGSNEPSGETGMIRKKIIAQTSSEIEDDKTTEKLFASVETKTYDSRGKIDPFKPFFNMDEPPPAILDAKPERCPEIKSPRRLTSLENIHLSQLRLTGIMRTETGNKGLVEDASQKAYIVARGTKIGTDRGKVIAVLADRIIIEEKRVDEYCNISLNEKELTLRNLSGK